MTFHRYRNSESYHDRGEVVATFQDGGDSETSRAPLQVWSDRNEWYIAAYAVRVWRDAEKTLAWFDGPQSEHFGHQVLRRGTPVRALDLRSLLSDPILRAELSAGQAGPPPQLEWLGSSNPMAKLFRSGYRFDSIPETVVDGRRCVGVRATGDDGRYIFWIDQPVSLIRRVDLPLVRMTGRSDRDSTTLRLSIDLRDASFQPTTKRPTLDGFPIRPNWVHTLIPPPPEEPSWLGRSFDMSPWTGLRGTALTINPAKDQWTVILFVAGGNSAQDALSSLLSWADRIPTGMRRHLQIIFAVDPEVGRQSLELQAARSGGTIDAIVVPAGGKPVAVAASSTVVVNHNGHIQWSQPLTPESLPTFGVVLADITRQKDVPASIREQARENEHQFQEQLKRQAELSLGQAGDRSAR